jgi:hypothetical protein
LPFTPYVTAAAFTAHPTYLDLDDLRSGSSSGADQTAELTNILLMASAAADNYCEQPLAAHGVTQRLRCRFDRDGNLKIHPDHNPVISVTSLGWGLNPTALTTYTAPAYWAEDDRNLIFPMSGGGQAGWTGSLQFNTASPGAQVFTQMQYVAGRVSTLLTAASTAGATTLQLADTTGVMPGASYRIWEPGVEEYVTVAATWTPTAPAFPAAPTPGAVPLASGALFAHASGMGLSGLHPDMHLAVVNYAISQLMRPDTSHEDAYPDTRLASGTRQADPRQDGSGLVAEAMRLLEPFARKR